MTYNLSSLDKLILHGPGYLSDRELIIEILKQGSGAVKASALADKLIKKYRSVKNIDNALIGELLDIIPTKKAAALKATFELGRRMTASTEETQSVKKASDAYQIIAPLIGHLEHEECWLICLNRASKVRAVVNISKGGVAGTVVDGKIVFGKALSHRASSVILAHNHPSGNRNPSDADISLTKKLKTAGACLDIPLLDHIIITSHSYTSLAEEGYM